MSAKNLTRISLSELFRISLSVFCRVRSTPTSQHKNSCKSPRELFQIHLYCSAPPNCIVVHLQFLLQTLLSLDTDGTLGSRRNTVSRLLAVYRRDKLGEFCAKLGEFALELTELSPQNLVRAKKAHLARCLEPCSAKPCSARLRTRASPQSVKRGFRCRKAPISHHPRKGGSESKKCLEGI